MGIGDDCAVLEGGLVVSTDLTVEEVHFRRAWVTLEEAGFRATAAALSDLAAMAAEPLGVLLSLAVASDEAQVGAPALQEGARGACRREGIPVLGGDLARSPGPVVVDVVALGRTEEPLLRSGARPGDELWVTGWLGGSAGAVEVWGRGGEPGPALRAAFASPRPRIRELLWLADRVELRSGIDLSDGLAGDAGHLSAASGVGVVLEAGAIPIHPALADHFPDSHRRLHLALQGGEDYEVCFSAPSGAVEGWVGAFREEHGIPLTRIGTIMEGASVEILDARGRPSPLKGGFSHFQEGKPG